jgi:hypothetical protein
LSVSLAAVASLALAACAGPAGTLQKSGPGVVQAARVAPPQALASVTTGTSTKADVQRALGDALTAKFDSGWEVWVYRWKGAAPTTRAATELVVLFDPSGVARKARLRPGYSG